MKTPRPKIPASLDPIAEEVLRTLQNHPEAAQIVIGGHLALKHYLDYRTTHDIDAWWTRGRNEAALDVVRRVIADVAERHAMNVVEREWGDVVSLEVRRADATVFSFQIASRSQELEAPVGEPWSPLLLESFADNIGSKMNALVNRGAPRDFTDIYQVVTNGLCAVEECWGLWQRKNPGKSAEQARQQLLKHLESIELRRPLNDIVNADVRESAKETRQFFHEQFIK